MMNLIRYFNVSEVAGIVLEILTHKNKSSKPKRNEEAKKRTLVHWH